MKKHIKSVWERRLCASASALVICCVLPCSSIATPDTAWQFSEKTKDIPFKIRPRAEVRTKINTYQSNAGAPDVLAEPVHPVARTSINKPAYKSPLDLLAAKSPALTTFQFEQPKIASAYVPAQPFTAPTMAPVQAVAAKPARASALDILDKLTSLSNAEQQAHSAREITLVKLVPPAEKAKLDEVHQQMKLASEHDTFVQPAEEVQAIVDKQVTLEEQAAPTAEAVSLIPPVNATLPWLVEKPVTVTMQQPESAALTIEAKYEPVTVPVHTADIFTAALGDEAPAEEPVTAPAEQVLALNPPVNATLPWLADKPAVQLQPQSVEIVSEVTSEPQPKIELLPQENQASQPAVAEEQPQPASTLIASIEPAAAETHIVAASALSNEKLVLMEPAAGEPTELMMAPKDPATPLPKLKIPEVSAQPLALEELPHEEPNQELPLTQPVVAEPATEKTTQKLSAESKDIIDRLQPEYNRSSRSKGPVKVERSHKGPVDDVKKHEAYGLKIAVKRPKMDTFRALESAYNSLIAGDQQYAITLYKEVLDQEPDNTMALFGLATTYHRAGQLQLARPLYAQLLDIDPQNVEGLNNFLVLLSDEAPAEALKELERLQKTHPTFSPLPAQMALIHEKNGDFSKAAECMRKALAISPENMKYQYDMAIIYDKMGSWEEAARWYQTLITAQGRGEKIPGKLQEIQQRLTFIRSNTSPAR